MSKDILSASAFAGAVPREDYRQIGERLAIDLAYKSGISRLGARWTAGRGAIYTFHSVVPDRAAHLDTDLRTTPAFLDRLLGSIRRAGIDVIAMGDLPGRLGRPESRRFVAFTFDDGYADNLHHALPVFEKHQMPLTIYVIAGLVSREFRCWWLVLEQLFREHDNIEIAAMNRHWKAATFRDKVQGYREVCSWVCDDVRGRAPMLEDVFRGYGLSSAALSENVGLSADQLKALCRNPLVTIGSHTQTHPALAQLPEADARREIAAGKAFLESIVEQPVEHLAYPFGGDRACGRREAKMAMAAGFKTAVTTRHGCLVSRHASDPHLLPRVGINRPYESVGLAWVQIDGLVGALRGSPQISA